LGWRLDVSETGGRRGSFILAGGDIRHNELYKSHFGISHLMVLTVTTNETHVQHIKELVGKITGGSKMFCFKTMPSLGDMVKAPAPAPDMLTKPWAQWLSLCEIYVRNRWRIGWLFWAAPGYRPTGRRFKSKVPDHFHCGSDCSWFACFNHGRRLCSRATTAALQAAHLRVLAVPLFGAHGKAEAGPSSQAAHHDEDHEAEGGDQAQILALQALPLAVYERNRASWRDARP
jgi:hypothetical protein